MSEIAIRDHLGLIFSTHIKPWFEIHESWSFSKVSREQLYETGMELNDAMRIASFYIKNKKCNCLEYGWRETINTKCII